ncbi:hypothetical protein Cgig2_027592 [Carnegiea gigantea]|uniref:Uncharacterized protein n=1 Tax=Carnegiea gigantea TaxID=171969 RepID=A0A9Q1QCX6_9CARY|nr:hypothetical protein Cgig2_027592 [Carnegiea gigantea]
MDASSKKETRGSEPNLKNTLHCPRKVAGYKTAGGSLAVGNRVSRRPPQRPHPIWEGFVTGNERALEELFGDDENHWKAEACLHVMATRIATAFASMRELPFVRYGAAKSLDPATVTTYRDLLPTKLAAYIWNNLTKYKATIANFPQTETCELLVVDRSVDPIAPLIHEWTYDAMCHDLLNLEGNKYVHEVPSKRGGPPKKMEVLLEEHDSIWQELRHLHIADVYKRLDEKVTNFKSNNKAAQIHGSRKICDLPESELQKIAHALPEYVEQKTMFSLHAEIADKIGRIIREQGLKDIGQLEQDLVFGDAGTKDDVSRENKLRLLIVYAGVHPENFEGEKGSKLMQAAQDSRDTPQPRPHKAIETEKTTQSENRDRDREKIGSRRRQEAVEQGRLEEGSENRDREEGQQKQKIKQRMKRRAGWAAEAVSEQAVEDSRPAEGIRKLAKPEI